MTIAQIRPPLGDPLDLIDAKLHLRVDSADEDAEILRYLKAAAGLVSDQTWRQLITATYRLTLSRFPYCDDVLVIPRPPLQIVNSIKYLDADGNEQTLDPSNYYVETDSEPGEIHMISADGWPETITSTRRPNAVTVEFVAGHATPMTVDDTLDTFTPKGRTFTDGDLVTVSNSGGALPGGLEAGVIYKIATSGTQFHTEADVLIDITDTGTGSHFIGAVPDEILQALRLFLSDSYTFRETQHRVPGAPNAADFTAATRLLRNWRVSDDRIAEVL